MPDRDEVLKALRDLPEHDLKEIINDLSLDPRIRRREGARGWWYRYAGSVAFITLILIGAAGFTKIQSVAGNADQAAIDAKQASVDVKNFTIKLRDGLVKSCAQNGNPLRTTVQTLLRDQIQQSRAADLTKFFPQIPPDQLQTLTRQANQQRRDLIKEIKPVDCKALYPK